MFLLVIGTRPEIVKMAPLVWEMERRKIDFRVFFTSQSFSPGMGKEFLEEMRYPPVHMLANGPKNWSAARTFSMLSEAIKAFKPRALIAEGDTHTVGLVSAMAMAKTTPFVHVEAGLRSFDPVMLEERYRRMADEAADLLLIPCQYQLENVKGCLGTKVVVGNTIADVIHAWQKKEKKPKHVVDVVLTLHRRELITNARLFEGVLQSLAFYLQKFHRQAMFPCHPHTAKFLPKWVHQHKHIQVVDPLNYRDFFYTLSASELVITDSGGVQEEACILGVPCGILRENTERWETIRCKAARLLPPDVVAIEPGILDKLNDLSRNTWENPYGENVGRRIVDILEAQYA
jgi:UDP-N-acetylglucosamine 2-epimerase (non-hydrolysing)